MITAMKWSRAFNGNDVLTCDAVGGGTQFEFFMRGHGEEIVKFRLRHRYGRRKRTGDWTTWCSLDKVSSNVPWCDAVRAGVKSFRAEEAEWAQNPEAHRAFMRRFN